MIKSALLIDTPDSCKECNIRRVLGYSNYCCIPVGKNKTLKEIDKHISDGTVADFCPLVLVEEDENFIRKLK